MKTLPLIRQLWPHALALGLYSLMALLVTYPLPRFLTSQIIANGPGQVDGYLGIWNIWWTAQALSRGQSPYLTPLLFHPQGLDLFWQTLSLPQGLLVLPLTLTVGPLPAYNLLILLSFSLGGYFSFLFIRSALALRGDYLGELATIVGGAVYAFAPFHMQKVLDAQLEVASIQWLPLWAWATMALLERRRWPLALIAAAALLWVGLGTWYYGLFTLMASGLMAGLWALRHPSEAAPDQRIWRVPRVPLHLYPMVLLWGLIPIALWFLVMLPRLLDLARTGDKLLGDARVEQQDAIADLIAFWLPNPNHPLWGPTVTAYYTAIHPGEILWNVSLGLVGTFLAFVGVAVAWRVHWRWLAVGLFAAIMALGAELVLAGWWTGIPGPYALIRDLPGVRSSHRPNHFVLISILTTALFAAVGLNAIVQRLPRRTAPWATFASLLALLAIDGWVGRPPLFQRPMPAPYLAMPAPDGALLPIPLHLNVSNSEHLWYQTAHGWPIVGGFIGREPPYPLARYAPGIRELRFGRAEPNDILSPGWPELARESLAAYQLRYVVFHHSTMGDSLPAMQTLIDEMGLAASISDELVSFYPVPEPAILRPLAYLGSGWGNLEQADSLRWRWMGDNAQIFLLNPHPEPRAVRLALDLEAFAQHRPLTMRLGSTAPFTLEVSRERMQRSLHLILPPGETVLYLTAPAEAPAGQPGRRLSLAVMGIAIE